MSDIIEWKDDYIVGLKEIDKQHERIFQLLNKLAAAAEAGKSHRDLSYLLSDVLNHFRYHFTSEEAFLEKHPDHDIHHQLHCDFTEKAKKFEEQSRKDEKFNFKEVSYLLADWHREHILKVDVKHFQYLLDKTVIQAID